MLTYTFDDHTYLYDQLYNAIKSDIMNGNLKPNDKLPSKRAFAKHLNISTITIETAYQQLIDEGFLYALPRKGFFVAKIDLPQTEITEEDHEEMPAEKPAYDWNFSANHMSPDHFPFSIWAKITRDILSHKQKELMRRSPAEGTAALREAIAHHLRSFRNLDVSPDQIIIGSGTEYLYGLLIQLLGFDKVYGIENPGYTKIGQIYQAHHVSYVKVDMDDEGIIPELLRKNNVDIVHISPSHHFPTGITMPITRRYQLLRWTDESDRHYIIEDDYDSEFRMMGRPIPSLFSIDHHHKVIYMNTFTKTLSSTIRISYMVLPKPLAKKFRKELSFYTCTVSTFEQYTLAKFISDGSFEKHLNRMRNIYRHKRNRILKVISNSPLHKISKIAEENAGLHFLIRIDLKCDDETFLKRCEERRVHISALSEYGINKPHTFIINYSSLPDEGLEEAFKTLYVIAMNVKNSDQAI